MSVYRHLQRFLHFTVIQLHIEIPAHFLCICLYDKATTYLLDTEAYSELSQTSKIELFAIITNGLKTLTDF